MRKFTVVGLIGAAMVAATAGFSHAEDVVVANMVIESTSEGDAGYATNSARSVAIELFAKEATSIPTVSAIPPEATIVAVKPEIVTVAPVAPVVQQDVAAAIVVPTPRPDFESTKSLTPDVAPPAKRVAQKAEPKVVKVSDRVEKKRITTVPLPVSIGVFR